MVATTDTVLCNGTLDGSLRDVITSHLFRHADRPLRFLDVGSGGGRRSRLIVQHLLRHPQSQFTGLDDWPDKSIRKQRVQQLTGPTAELIAGNVHEQLWNLSMQERQFDMARVVGTSDLADTISRLVLSWNLLVPGGTLILQRPDGFAAAGMAAQTLTRLTGAGESFNTSFHTGFRKPMHARRENSGEPEFLFRSPTLDNPWPDIRRSLASQWTPGCTYPEVCPVEFTNIRRHLLMHIWPVAGFGAWQWNCDQLLQRRHLFNGRRVIAIAVDEVTDRPETVMHYLRDLNAEFFVIRNDFRRREGISLVPLLKQVESQDPDEVTFFCHAKGVRYKVTPNSRNTSVFQWTEAMYRVLLDYWPAVQHGLSRKAMCSLFRRLDGFRTPGNHGWFYSGSFYWFRNRDVFQRNWRHLDIHQLWGVESWPGHQFTTDETHCLVGDGIDHLYRQDYWNRHVLPILRDWYASHSHLATASGPVNSTLPPG